MRVRDLLTVQGSIVGEGFIVVGPTAEMVAITGDIKCQSLKVIADDIWMENANISVTSSLSSSSNLGTGSLDRANKVAGGGGHGGSGGSSIPGLSGAPYGSYVYPSRHGSAGSTNAYSMCFCQNTYLNSFTNLFILGVAGVGLGGGVISLTADDIIMDNVVIRADGTSAINGNGGGSGGSILIQATTINGTGVITSNGGAGHTRNNEFIGGGGAGGRIAMHAQENHFDGIVTVVGGVGEDSYGGSGTLFYNTAGYKQITAQGNYGDNIHKKIPSNVTETMGSVAWLTDDDGAVSFEFDQVILVNYSSLALKISYRDVTKVSFNKKYY